MSIVSEQNIIGNPDLALATRPGNDTKAASYAFSNTSAAAIAEDNSHTPAASSNWTTPKAYAQDVAVAEATDSPTTAASATGPAGEDELSSLFQYGTQGGAPLTENSSHTTALEQVAKVLAAKTNAVTPIIPDPTAYAVKSLSMTDDGEQGPVASGGRFNGYGANNQYYQNTQSASGAGSTTIPAPIENTGLKAVSGDLDPTALVASNSTGADGPGDTEEPREETTGQSAVGAYSQGDVNAPKVHRSKKNPQADRP